MSKLLKVSSWHLNVEITTHSCPSVSEPNKTCLHRTFHKLWYCLALEQHVDRDWENSPITADSSVFIIFMYAVCYPKWPLGVIGPCSPGDGWRFHFHEACACPLKNWLEMQYGMTSMRVLVWFSVSRLNEQTYYVIIFLN